MGKPKDSGIPTLAPRRAGFWPLVALIAAAVLTAACGPADERPGIYADISSAASGAGDGGSLDMAVVVPTDWDRMFAFPGYTTDTEISEAIGSPWGNGDVSRIPYDGEVLVAFVKGDTVAEWAVLNGGDRAAVRFVSYGEPVARSHAHFSVSSRGETVGGNVLFYLERAGNVGRS